MIEWNGFFFFTICKDSDVFFFFVSLPSSPGRFAHWFSPRIPDAGTGSVPCAHAAEHESMQRLISHG